MTKDELLKKAFSKLPEVENRGHFDFVIEYFQQKEIEGILTETFSEKIRLEIVKILNFTNCYNDYADAELREEDLILLAEVLKELRGYFKEAVANQNLKQLTAAVYLLDVLNMPSEEIIDLDSYSAAEVEWIRSKLIILLKSSKFNLVEFKRQNRSEAKNIDKFYNQIEKHNFSYAYSFIRGLEAGINIFAFSVLFRSIIRFAALFDISLMSDLLESKTDPLEMMAYFNLFAEKQIRDMINYIPDNKWLLMELLRRILKSEDLQLTDSEIEILTGKLKKLALTDKIFFREVIRLFREKKTFSKLLALVLSKLDRDYLDLYLGTVNLNEYDNNLASCQLFLKTFIANTSLANQLYLCSGVKEKWDSFLKDLIDAEEYLQRIIYTDYYSFVYHYHFLSLETNLNAENELKRVLAEFKSSSYNWYESFKGIRAAYFVFLTKMIILAGIVKEKDFVLSVELNEELSYVLNDRRFWLRFFGSGKEPEVISKIRKNL
ncbi:MAG: hypothetical protein ACOCV1_05335 [Bacillota bacterium]